MTTLPEPLSRWQDLRYIKEVSPGKEWHAECPVCGDSGHIGNDRPDRFHMHSPNSVIDAWHGACRKCGFFAIAEENDWEPSKSYFTESEVRKMNLEIEARREYERIESERMRNKINWLRNQEFWKGFNEAMSEQQRQEWRGAGIPDPIQDRLQLGYVCDKKTYIDGKLVKLPALTIPYFDAGWEAINVQYRLLGDSCGTNEDRYRFTSGLRAPTYLTDPDQMPSGKVVVVEGAKKAIVVYIKIALELGRSDYSVVAFPSKMPNDYQVSWLKDASIVYLGLDPDAHDAMHNSEESYVHRAAQMIGMDKTRIVSWPDKPDDLVNGGHANAQDLVNIIAQARRL